MLEKQINTNKFELSSKIKKNNTKFKSNTSRKS